MAIQRIPIIDLIISITISIVNRKKKTPIIIWRAFKPKLFFPNLPKSFKNEAVLLLLTTIDFTPFPNLYRPVVIQWFQSPVAFPIRFPACAKKLERQYALQGIKRSWVFKLTPKVIDMMLSSSWRSCDQLYSNQLTRYEKHSKSDSVN